LDVHSAVLLEWTNLGQRSLRYARPKLKPSQNLLLLNLRSPLVQRNRQSGYG
jgi:hypothetical protein